MDRSMQWLAVSGEDADEFLQGQLSNDIYALQDHNWQLAAYCSPQGKVLAVIWLWRNQDAVWLGMPADIIEAVQKRLRMFVLRSQVVIDLCDVSSAPVAAITSDAVLPKTIVRLEDNAALLSGVAGGDLFVGHAAPDEAGREDHWRAVRIRAGIAQIYHETADVFLPQALGLDKASAVSFTKGCYVGQENVARLHYKSQTRRHLGIAEVSEKISTTPGTHLHNMEQRGGVVLDYGHDNQGSVVQAVLPERLFGMPLRLDGCNEVLYFKRCYESE